MKATQTLFASLAVCLAFSFNSPAHNNVVVIPLENENAPRPATVERTLIFNWNSLGGTAEQASTGLLFPHDVLRSALLFIKKPQDWDGTSSVEIELLARGLGLGSETFNITITDFDDGDRFQLALTDDPFLVTTTNRLFQIVAQLRVFSANFPPQELQQDWWHISIQRNGSAGTNMRTIILNSVAITYRAINE